MDWPLYWRLPPKAEVSSDTLLDRFLDFVASKDLELYPAQEEAILALLDGKNVILTTPTGSGKSLVALAMHFRSLAMGRRSYYTCPIKALVNEKFRALCADFGPDQVGMITGDGSVNAQAPIICCTAEILSNLALREGPTAPVDDVIMDEFHYYSDKQRGVAWQIPLLTLPQSRFLLMSATLGDMDFFAREITSLTGEATEIVRSGDRPVPLDFEYRETPLHETIADLVSKGQAPVYLVNFSQREAGEEAQNLLSVDFASKEEKAKIKEALEGVTFQSPYGKEFQKLLRHGIGLHHAGLLPKYRALVEKLAQQGLLKVISGTDTLGVGVNVPIRTVLFTKLSKYDGDKSAVLSVRDFHQISGRAGRRGFDTRGTVVAQAPAHVIENARLKSKAEGDAKKLRKIVLRTPPPRFVMWSKETFNKLINSSPEALISRFHVSHSMLLSVLGRSTGGFEAMKRLVRGSHGSRETKKQARKAAFALFRSLLDRQIVEYVPQDGKRTQVRVNMDLQADFSLNQNLALYLLDALKVLDPNSPAYALDVLTLVESILEDPDLILRKQLDRVKTEKMQEMKMNGVEYDQRMEELEKCEYPKPNRDFIYETFRVFVAAHPWVGEDNIRPKSIAREMYETFQSFPEYIREYELQRAEGVLLRYLSEVYKVLEQTVPEASKDDEIRAMVAYFGTMVRQVDSSLLDDWEKMREAGELAGAPVPSRAVVDPAAPPLFARPEFKLFVRNEVHRLVRALSKHDPEEALALLLPEKADGAPLTEADLKSAVQSFEAEHARMRTDPPARAPRLTTITGTDDGWSIEQFLLDPEELNDWAMRLELGRASSSEDSLRFRWVGLGPVGEI